MAGSFCVDAAVLGDHGQKSGPPKPYAFGTRGERELNEFDKAAADLLRIANDETLNEMSDDERSAIELGALYALEVDELLKVLSDRMGGEACGKAGARLGKLRGDEAPIRWLNAWKRFKEG